MLLRIIIPLAACWTLALIMLKIFKVGNRRRGVIKMLASITFLTAGIWGCVYDDGGLSVFLPVGLFFAMLGDLFLVFMDKRQWFIAGVMSFAAASAILSVYSVLCYGWQWWSVLLFAVVTASSVLCQKFKVYDFGSYKTYLNVYTTLVSACGCLGFTLLCQGTSYLPKFLFGIGCFMYFASDLCLGLYLFKFRNRFVDALNTALYFPGMFLIACSLLI